MSRSLPIIRGKIRVGPINVSLTIARTGRRDGKAGGPLSVTIPLDDGYSMLVESLGFTTEAVAHMDRIDALMASMGQPLADRAEIEWAAIHRLGPAE
jgi:hypothetical protein